MSQKSRLEKQTTGVQWATVRVAAFCWTLNRFVPELPLNGSNRRAEFQGGLVFKIHRLFYHSTLGSRVVKKKSLGPRP